jgi:hypothetical protein
MFSSEEPMFFKLDSILSDNRLPWGRSYDPIIEGTIEGDMEEMAQVTHTIDPGANFSMAIANTEFVLNTPKGLTSEKLPLGMPHLLPDG